MYCMVLYFFRNFAPMENYIANVEAQMRKGILELCILNIIASEEEIYPSEIIARLKESKLIVVEGTLYPLLTRLKNQGLLSYQWVESPSGPPRKYYALTEDGRACLDELNKTWNELIFAVKQTIKKSKRNEENSNS